MKFSAKILVFFILAISAFYLVPQVLAYGEAGQAPVCTNFQPPKPWLYYASAVGNDQVKLVWDQNPLADSWTVAYGVQSGQYIYGRDRFGDNNTKSTTIGSLPPGTYYFVVRANNGCMPGPFSNEQSVRVGRAYVPPAGYEPRVTPLPGAPQVTPTSVPGYRPPTVAPRREITGREGPTIRPTIRVTQPPTGRVLPTPTAGPGFLQRLFNLFFGLFGLGR